MANSEDPDEMQPNAAFHLGLHCLVRLRQSSEAEIHHNLEIFLPVTSIRTQWAVPYLLYENVLENPSEYKGLKCVISIVIAFICLFALLSPMQT